MNRKANLRLKLLTYRRFVTACVATTALVGGVFTALLVGSAAASGPLAAGSGTLPVSTGTPTQPIGTVTTGTTTTTPTTTTSKTTTTPKTTTTAVSTKMPVGKAYLPPAGKIFQGSTAPVGAYTKAVGKHPAVYQELVAWGQYLPGITKAATQARARMMLSISTMYGSKNVVTPQGIADGQGDKWLSGLGAQIATSKNITYVELMPEMDNAAAPYSAFNANGSPRTKAYSAAEFKLAWQRATLILRGGPVTGINKALKKLGMSGLKTNATSLPEAPVAMVWDALTAGTPVVNGNAPANYFPGRSYVDWVSTDFYSDYPDFKRLTPFVAQYSQFPFMFSDYAIWNGDNDTTFIGQVFSWIAEHHQARMLIYDDASSHFALSAYPASATALRHAIAGASFPAYAPEWAP
jgi:hypothetical protein